MVQTLSWASIDNPIVLPVTQWLGSGLGQNGSTSNIGAMAPVDAGVDGSAAGAVADGDGLQPVTRPDTQTMAEIQDDILDMIGRASINYPRAV